MLPPLEDAAWALAHLTWALYAGPVILAALGYMWVNR